MKPTAARYAGIALVSAAGLMLELCCTRIFSVTLFYHFAFLVVSMALFGIGAAGVTLFFRQGRYSAETCDGALARHALGFGLSVMLALILALRIRIPPELDLSSLLPLGLLFAGVALPFFFFGMVVSLLITLHPEHVGRLYFFDLAGAAAGCLLTLPVLQWLGGPSAVLFAGALGASAGPVFVWQRRRWRLAALALSIALLGLCGLDSRVHLFAIPSVKAVDERAVLYEGWNAYSRVTVSRTPEDFLWLNIDSDAATRIFSKEAWQGGRNAARRFSESRVAALVYAIQNRGRALIIGPGGGADIVSALSRGVHRIIGVELNRLIVDSVMGERFAEYSGDLYRQPGVEVVVGEGRSFVRRSGERFGSIQATLVDTWAASSAGAFTLSENHLYTREAFVDFIGHLEPDGVLSMTRWLRHPPREFERLLAIAVAALDDLGIRERHRHLFVAADARMGTLLVKRSPYREEELETLRRTVAEDGLRVLFDPAAPPRPGDLIDTLARAADPRPVWESTAADISPPTDDRPFFFYTTRPRDFVGRMLSDPDKNDLGVRVLRLLLLVVLVLVLLVFGLPLLARARRDLAAVPGRGALHLGYFFAIGVGFIALEISWMQRFILFLGHPIHATGVVLTALLLGTGLGSLWTRNVPQEKAPRWLGASCGAVLAIAAVYALLLGPLFLACMGWPVLARILLAATLLFVPAFWMGQMLPLGVRLLEGPARVLVPWAWGVNGAASVLGSVVTVVLSLNLGYRAVQLLAALVYLLGTAGLLLARRGVRPAAAGGG